jgi:hypothetical protein
MVVRRQRMVETAALARARTVLHPNLQVNLQVNLQRGRPGAQVLLIVRVRIRG